jgi:hypothetical protein
MPDLLKYPPKILVAFGETIGGGKDIIDWFLKNGYPELAAFSYSVQGSDEAVDWLLKNGFPELAALDSAIDDDQKAYEWLQRNHYEFHIVFADAVHGKGEAIECFLRHELGVLLNITQKIRKLRDSHTFDYHKLHF